MPEQKGRTLKRVKAKIFALNISEHYGKLAFIADAATMIPHDFMQVYLYMINPC